MGMLGRIPLWLWTRPVSGFGFYLLVRAQVLLVLKYLFGRCLVLERYMQLPMIFLIFWVILLQMMKIIAVVTNHQTVNNGAELLIRLFMLLKIWRRQRKVTPRGWVMWHYNECGLKRR